MPAAEAAGDLATRDGWGVARLGRAVVAPLLIAPRLALTPLRDLRSLARSVSVLPEVADHLAEIGARVRTLDDEVGGMHRAVEEIRVDVVGMRESVEPLDARLDGVQGAVSPLVPEIERVREGLERIEEPLAEMRTTVGHLEGTAERFGHLASRLPGGRRRREP